MNRPLPHRLARVSLVLLVLIVFARLFRAEFVEWDDATTIARNPAFNPPTLRAIAAYWSRAEMSLYVPLTYSVWGALAMLAHVSQPDSAGSTLNPWVFHTANIAIHAMTVLVIFGILRRLIDSDRAAWIGAALFAVHPVQVETVAWASGTKDLLCGLFTMLAVLLLIHYRHRPRRFTIVLMTLTILAACLSKPAGIVAPIFALIIDTIVLKSQRRQSALTLSAGIAIACVFAFVGKLVQPPVMAQRPAVWSRPLIATDAIAFYMSKLIYPVNLAIDYGRSPARVFETGSLCYTWIAPIIASAIVLWFARNRFLRAAALLFLVGVGPVIGFIPFTFQAFSTVADHYLYLSMLGVAITAAAVAVRVRSRAAIAMMLALIAACSIQSFRQSANWQNTDALFSHTLDVNPRSAMAHTNWAVALSQRHEDAAAFEHLQKAIGLDPNYAFAHLNLATLLLKTGDRAAASREYAEVLRIYQSQRNYDPKLASDVRELIRKLDERNAEPTPPENP